MQRKKKSKRYANYCALKKKQKHPSVGFQRIAVDVIELHSKADVAGIEVKSAPQPRVGAAPYAAQLLPPIGCADWSGRF